LKTAAINQLKRTSKLERAILGGAFKIERVIKKNSQFFEKLKYGLYLQNSCHKLVSLLQDTEETLAKREAFFSICRESLKLAAKNLAAKQYLYAKKQLFIRSM